MQEYLSQLLTLPRLTVEQLAHQTNNHRDQRGCRTGTNTPIGDSYRHSPQGNIQVKEPFYIDRAKLFQVHTCQHSADCLACRYAKMHPHDKNKFYFAKSKGVRFKTQSIYVDKQIQIAVQQTKIKVLKPTITSDHLFKCLQVKIQGLDVETKLNFAKKTGRNCQQISVIHACLDFFTSKHISMHSIGAQNSQKNVKSLKDVYEDLQNTNISGLLQNKNFVRMIRNIGKQKTWKNALIASRPLKNGIIKKTNLITGNKDQSRQESKNENKKQFKKKVKIMISEGNDEQNKARATEIFTQLCIDFQQNGEFQLGQKVKQSLSDLARLEFKSFKETVKELEDIISNYMVSGKDVDKIYNKMTVASKWIKNCMLTQDSFQFEKQKKIKKMMRSFKNIRVNKSVKSKKKSKTNHIQNCKNSLQNSSENQKQEPSQQEQEFKQINHSSRHSSTKVSRLSSKSRNSSNKDPQQFKLKIEKKDRRKNSSIRGQKIIDLANNIQVYSNHRPYTQSSLSQSQKSTRNLNSENTVKLIAAEEGDEILDEKQLEKRFENKKLSARKSSYLGKGNKNSFIKYAKEDEKQLHDQIEQHFRNLEEINQKVLSQKARMLQKIDVNLILINIRNSRQAEGLKQGTQSQKKIQQIMVLQQKKRKHLLKLKVTQLLKENRVIIESVQQALKQLNMDQYIIQKSDGVFTQKKKMRMLKQLVRLSFRQNEFEEKVVRQIVDYLRIYDQNCNILIQSMHIDQKDKDSECVANFKSLIDRKDVFDGLHFYQLKQGFKFGRNDEQDLNFVFSKEDEDQKKNKKPKKRIKFALQILESKQNQDKFQYKQKQDSELVQMNMQYVGHTRKLASINKSQQKFKTQQSVFQSPQVETSRLKEPFRLMNFVKEKKRQREKFKRDFGLIRDENFNA